MIAFKSCPRCRGDCELERDHFGKYWLCLSCSWLLDLDLLQEPFPLLGNRKGQRHKKRSKADMILSTPTLSNKPRCGAG